MVFGGSDDDKLEEVIYAANEALWGGDRNAVLTAMQNLLEAWHAHPQAKHEITVRETLARLRRATEATEGLSEEDREEIERALFPCVQCGGNDLLVSAPARVDGIAIANTRVPAVLTIIICADCGDTRWRTENVDVLERLRTLGTPAFSRMRARGAQRGPFR